MDYNEVINVVCSTHEL